MKYVYDLRDLIGEIAPIISYQIRWASATYTSIKPFVRTLVRLFRFDYMRSHRRAQDSWIAMHMADVEKSLGGAILDNPPDVIKPANTLMEEWESELRLIMEKCTPEDSFQRDVDYWRKELTQQDNENGHITPQVVDLANQWPCIKSE